MYVYYYYAAKCTVNNSEQLVLWDFEAACDNVITPGWLSTVTVSGKSQC